MRSSSPPLSAFVVSFNRAAIVGTCLRGLRFADEVIVVDKSSTDDTPRIAAALADRVITVPWSPTVEETRAFAAEQCAHEWILFLDDDECLSAAAADVIRRELSAPRADAYAFPLRHYILGTHDEQAYYWPEHHVRCFRRGAVTFGPTVHAGMTLRPDRVMQVAPETGACIHHLSHQDTAQWIEKANRYTARPDRVRVAHAGQDLIGFAHARIEHWLACGRDRAPGGYPSAVALLRAVYDIVDRLKVWEEERGLDGAARFAAVCAALEAEYGAAPMQRTAAFECGNPSIAPLPDAAELLRRSLATLRDEHDAALRRMADAATEADRRVEAAEAARHTADAACRQAVLRADAAERALRAIESSTSWRATAWLRRTVGRWRPGRQ